jgi:putative nucleotidyltransferase with HDIG domain
MFQSLHPHDQRHLLVVYQKAGDAGLPDSVRQAALLHDIGKVTLSGKRISLAARIIHVILQRISPSTDRALAELNLPGLGVGLRLANHHGKLGADRLRALGVSCRVCEIVEIHDDKNQHDGDIRLLQEIDSATP